MKDEVQIPTTAKWIYLPGGRSFIADNGASLVTLWRRRSGSLGRSLYMRSTAGSIPARGNCIFHDQRAGNALMLLPRGLSGPRSALTIYTVYRLPSVGR